MVNAWRFEKHDSQALGKARHADVLQRPVPVVVVEATERLQKHAHEIMLQRIITADKLGGRHTCTYQRLINVRADVY